MLFLIQCQDGPQSQEIRSASRTAHLAYVRDWGERIRFAGPLVDEATDRPAGSIFIAEFADRGEAERFVAGDPYNQAGLFDSVTISPVRQVLPEH